MTPTENAAALRAEIARWDERRDKTYQSFDKFPMLCGKYRQVSWGPIRCHGCPIHTLTGKHDCDGTPYAEAVWAFHEYDDNPDGAFEAHWHDAHARMAAVLKDALRMVEESE